MVSSGRRKFIIRRFDNVMPRKNALSRAKSSIVTDSLRITQSSGLDRHAVYARQRVDEFRNDDIASTQSARQAKDATDLVVEPDRQYAQFIRRLTPWECELLQGFPPGWTDVPSASDSARYRALGNSVAIPCVEFIMKSLREVTELEAEKEQIQGEHHAEK